MTPIKITDKAPAFPCWLWCREYDVRGDGIFEWHKWAHDPRATRKSTYWHPDQPTAPTVVPEEAANLAKGGDSNAASKSRGEVMPLISSDPTSAASLPTNAGETPRSAAEWNLHEPLCADGSQLAETMFKFARTLERELSAAQAELSSTMREAVKIEDERAALEREFTTLQAEYRKLVLEDNAQITEANAEIARLKYARSDKRFSEVISERDLIRSNAFQQELKDGKTIDALKQAHADTLAKLGAKEADLRKCDALIDELHAQTGNLDASLRASALEIARNKATIDEQRTTAEHYRLVTIKQDCALAAARKNADAK